MPKTAEDRREYNRAWREARKGKAWQVSVAEKRCPKCDLTKPAAAFNICRSRITGLHSWCRECQSAWASQPHIADVRKARRVERYASNIEFRARAIVRSLKARAGKLGVPFEIRPEWVAERLSAGHCEVTGLPLDFTSGTGRSAYSPSVDRVDGEQGYIESNCRVIVWGLNAAFGPWGEDAFLQIAEAFVQSRRGRRAA